MTNDKITQSSTAIAGLIALTCLPTNATTWELLLENYHYEIGQSDPNETVIQLNNDLTSNSTSEVDEVNIQALFEKISDLLKNTTDIPADFQQTINEKFWDLLA